MHSYAAIIRNHIEPALGLRPLQKITSADVAMAISGAAGDRTRELAFVIMRNAFKTAVQWGLIVRNPTDGVPKPRVVKKDQHFLTQPEVIAFLAAARSDRLYALYLLFIFTGIRPGELYGLQWDSVDLAGGSIRITRTLNARTRKLGPPKRQKSKRTISISGRIVAELRAHRKRMLIEGTPHGYVFVDTEGHPLRESNVTRRSYKPLLKAAGLPSTVRMYDLRHTAASLAIAANIHSKVMSERFGHASSKYTEDVYGHIMPNLQAEAALALDHFSPTRILLWSALSQTAGRNRENNDSENKKNPYAIRVFELEPTSGFEPLTC